MMTLSDSYVLLLEVKIICNTNIILDHEDLTELKLL